MSGRTVPHPELWEIHTLESWARAVLADIYQALAAQAEGTTKIEVPAKVWVFQLEGASGYGVNLDVIQPTDPGSHGHRHRVKIPREA
jgi:hypothetical protein